MRRFNPEKELIKIQKGNKNKIIFGIMALLLIIAIGSSYALYQVRYSKRIIYTKVAQFSNKDLNLAVYVDGVQQNEFPEKNNNLTFIDLVCDKGMAISSWDDDIWGLRILTPIILPNKCNAYFTTEENVIKEFSYSGNEEEYEISKDGLYKIELWGAAGGRGTYSNSIYKAGQGGYTSGIIELNQNDILYFYVGGKGKNGIIGANANTGISFNGGGKGLSSTDINDAGGGGGGATDVRLVKGTTWDDFNSLKSRIMVAGGGGGASAIAAWSYDIIIAGSGGGLSGAGEVYAYQDRNLKDTLNATQTTGYKFGIGQDGYADTAAGAGAGGGYYGGLTSNNPRPSCGGGGSSFISGHEGCNAISQSSTQNNITHTESPNHYSNKVFTNTVMIDGLGYYWTDTRQTYIGMPTFDGTGIMEGNNDNGYARITYIGPKS